MARAGIFISVKDLQRITGFSYSRAYNLMKSIKDALAKEKHQHITISEYCRYEGCSEDEVRKILKR